MAEDREQSTDLGELLDWDEATMHPMTVSGFQLAVRGVAPVPMDVRFRLMPIGIVPNDYRGVEVRGIRREPVVQVETPWDISIDTKELGGAKKGFVLVGATKREYFPPKAE